MCNEEIHQIKLEKHETRNVIDKQVNGSLTVIWRDWDDKLNINPKMIYTSSVYPWEIKGPHIHTKRDSFFVCVRGKVVFVIKDLVGKFHEIQSSEGDPVLVHVPKNYASAHMNLTDNISTVLTIANLAWRPNDKEMKNTEFHGYDWAKWRNNA